MLGFPCRCSQDNPRNPQSLPEHLHHNDAGVDEDDQQIDEEPTLEVLPLVVCDLRGDSFCWELVCFLVGFKGKPEEKHPYKTLLL